MHKLELCAQHYVWSIGPCSLEDAFISGKYTEYVLHFEKYLEYALVNTLNLSELCCSG